LSRRLRLKLPVNFKDTLVGKLRFMVEVSFLLAVVIGIHCFIFSIHFFLSVHELIFAAIVVVGVVLVFLIIAGLVELGVAKVSLFFIFVLFFFFLLVFILGHSLSSALVVLGFKSDLVLTLLNESPLKVQLLFLQLPLFLLEIDLKFSKTHFVVSLKLDLSRVFLGIEVTLATLDIAERVHR